MRVPRRVNVAWQTFNAWQHRNNIDKIVKASDIQNAFTTQWKNPNRDFTPHKVTVSSPDWASGSQPLRENPGLL